MLYIIGRYVRITRAGSTAPGDMGSGKRDGTMRIGLDVGSTTLKCVVLNDAGELVFDAYERHFGKTAEKAAELLQRMAKALSLTTEPVSIAVTGSAGMGMAERLNLAFIQEVYASRLAMKKYIPDADVAIELGGEDAKILFLTGGLEVRMNGSCAGGTGAFIDQMATLLNTTPVDMNEMAKNSERTYAIASRCGVFAKTDIQPLINQGARKEDICRSIFAAVVNQTIAGLAQGRQIRGNIVYLGGPMTFFSELRNEFDRQLKTKGVCPRNSLYYVALGAAFSSECSTLPVDQLIRRFSESRSTGNYNADRPLFESREAYDAFLKRHSLATVPRRDPATYAGRAYLGVDSGSTTVKAVLMTEDGELLMDRYGPNKGNPIPMIREFINRIYEGYPQITIAGSAATGYGEELMKNAFRMDAGLVETMAHFIAARTLQPDVDFIIDIGGQDIKCFHVRNGAVDNIFLNEACSSGCGSFLQTFAGALGYDVKDFAKLGLFADRPVDLGSRCTVFMNSSVKQAQKDGATIENISAGLSVSVVKNAIYKVIRAARPEDMGRHIVVQGGTFLNDAVLRAFEREIGYDVIRPAIAELMGAYGAALYARSVAGEKSTLLSAKELEKFTHTVRAVNCNGCGNHCHLTVNTFDGGRRFIGGNRCEKPVRTKAQGDPIDMYTAITHRLDALRTSVGAKGKIGIPLGLNMYELLPFWVAFWQKLGYSVVVSPATTREMYQSGQHTIPSDTVCYPAKVLHGHVIWLVNQGVDAIFYPCMSYNLDEGLGDNHYNCPVVAYYPEVLAANVPELEQTRFINDYVGLHRPQDFPRKMYGILKNHGFDVSHHEVREAARAAYEAYQKHMEGLRADGLQMIEQARRQGKPIVVLAGRPYHVDPEINHGIDQLICDCGAAVISEEVVSALVQKFPVNVLNQWMYHSRLYAAAKYVTTQEDMQLIQLVSFGCGVDAITTDEVRSILEAGGKIYTQIKIDEITNLGAVKIRLRSLFAAVEQAKGGR